MTRRDWPVLPCAPRKIDCQSVLMASKHTVLAWSISPRDAGQCGRLPCHAARMAQTIRHAPCAAVAARPPPTAENFLGRTRHGAPARPIQPKALTITRTADGRWGDRVAINGRDGAPTAHTSSVISVGYGLEFSHLKTIPRLQTRSLHA